MGRILKVVGLCMLAGAVLHAPLAAQVDVSGTWTLTVDSPEAPGDLKAVFSQDGTTVEGAIEAPMVSGTELSDGVIEGNKLTFLLHVDFEGQWFTVEVEAEVSGDEMTGSFYMAEMGTMAFTGKRTEG